MRITPWVSLWLLLVLVSCQCGAPAAPAPGDDDPGPGPFTDPGGPTTTITAPADGAFVRVGSTLTFTCTAVDEQDGAVPNASIAWSSSIDGAIGVGAVVQNALPSVGDHEISCVATDSDGKRGADVIVVHAVDDFPPTVTIEEPADGAFFGANQSITFRGAALDPETGALPNAELRWLDGAAAIGAGAIVTTSLPLGDHAIALTAIDAAGSVGRAEITIHVVEDVPPQCTIVTPADGATVAVGQTTVFTASCNNPDGPPVQNADVRWTSSVDGALGIGTTVQNALATRGDHVITICAVDPVAADVEGCASVDVVVADNAAPVPSIQEPAPGDVFRACRDVPLRCSAFDPEGQLVTVRWTDGAGDVVPAGGNVDWSPATPGVHVLTCTATDAGGASASATVTITIESPTVEITDPGDGDNFTVGDTVQLRGRACDTELGDLTGAELVWTSSRDGVFGTGEQRDFNGLSIGVHTISLTATAGPRSATDSIQLTIDP